MARKCTGAPRTLLVVLSVLLALGAASAQRMSLAQVLSPRGKAFDENGSNFDILTRSLRIANLTDAALSMSNFTLFAPNDRAFVRTMRYIAGFAGRITDEEGAFNAMVRLVEKGVTLGNVTIAGAPLLQQVLLYHAVNSRVSLAMLTAHPSLVRTLADGGKAKFINAGNGELVDNAPMAPNPAVVPGNTDIMLANGVVVHVIDAVLLPIPASAPVEDLFCPVM